MDVLTDANAALARLSAAPAAWMLVLYEGPLTALNKAMALGTPPSEALSTWISTAQDILALVRKNRSNVLALETGDIACHPETARTLLRLPTEIFNGIFDGNIAQDHDRDRTVFQFLALTILQNDAVGLKLANELDLHCHALSDDQERDEADADMFFEHYQDVSTKAVKEVDSSWRTQLARTQKENDILISQIDAMQNELAEQYKKIDNLQLRTEQLNQGLDSYHSKVSDMQRKVDVRDSRLEEKKHQAEALAQQIRALTAQASDLNLRIQKAQAETRIKQQRLNSITHSRSYRFLTLFRKRSANVLTNGDM